MHGKAELIKDAQSGDPAAIGRLIDACCADVHRYSYKYCRAGDVDDAVQEALLIVSRKIGGLRGPAAFASWLVTIIKRECQRLAMIGSRHTSLEDIEQQWHIVTQSDEALRIDLIDAIESLPPHYRLVLLLRDFGEHTIAEISDRLCEPVGAVKSRLHRAREMVREYLR